MQQYLISANSAFPLLYLVDDDGEWAKKVHTVTGFIS